MVSNMVNHAFMATLSGPQYKPPALQEVVDYQEKYHKKQI